MPPPACKKSRCLPIIYFSRDLTKVQGKQVPSKGGKVNNVRLRLAAAALVCVAAALLALRLFMPAVRGQNEDTSFLGTGQLAAKTLAHGSAIAPRQRSLSPAQSALGTLQAPPGFAWAAVVAPDGHVLARKGDLPRGHRWNASLSSTDLPAGKEQAACTVFPAPVPLDHPGTVAYVALRRDLFGQVVAHRRLQALGAAGACLLVWLLAALLVWRVRVSAPVCRLTREARAAISDVPNKAPFSPGAAGGWATLTQALNDLVSFLYRQSAQVREDEAKFRSLFENAAHGVWQSTPHGKYLCLNPAMAAIYGYGSPEELSRKLEESPASMYVSAGRWAEFLRLMREQNGVADFESQVKCADGRTIWVSETVRVVPGPTEAECFWEGTVEDITARKRVEADRSHLGSHLRLLLESSSEGIYGVDYQGQCTFINTMGAQMLGYAVSEVLGQNIHALIHHSHAGPVAVPPRTAPIFISPCRPASGSGSTMKCCGARTAHRFPPNTRRPRMMEGGRTTGAVVTFVDITSRKAVEAEQQRLLEEALERADHDPLTCLLNHRAFHKRLDEEADRAQRAGTLLAVALLDIDNFKFFNDVYGHKVGDEVLCIVADSLRASSRSYDVLARFGGDEFAILMPCSPGETSTSLAEQLNQRLAGVSYRLPEHDIAIPLGLSLGVAVFPSEGPTRMEALEIADDRLRRAKTGGDEDGYAERVRSAMTHEREGFSMLDALVTAVDNKDRYTRRHSEDVMRYSVADRPADGAGRRNAAH